MLEIMTKSISLSRSRGRRGVPLTETHICSELDRAVISILS